jgi:hypothetical protein
VVPLIALAEICSWFAVISTDFLGNVLENSIWTIAFSLIGVALIRLLFSFRGAVRFAIAAAAFGVAGYVLFMATFDVPMYVARWHADLESGKPLLGLFAGLHDLATHWVVTHRFAPWHNEIPSDARRLWPRSPPRAALSHPPAAGEGDPAPGADPGPLVPGWMTCDRSMFHSLPRKRQSDFC